MNHSDPKTSNRPNKPSSSTRNPSAIPRTTTTTATTQPPCPPRNIRAHQPPPTPLLAPLHTNMAATLRSLYDAQPTLYLTYTFPALLAFNGDLIPIVLALEENYPDFQCDVRRMLAVPLDCGSLMLRVVIAGGLDVYLCEENMCAALRHLRQARGGGCVVVEELGRPVYPGFEGEGLERLVEEDGFGRSVFGA